MKQDLILPDFGSYDGKGPKELNHGEDKEVLFNVQVARNTSVTGEQIAISVPIYKSDSYEDMIKRMDLAYHIPQLRLESENKLMLALEKKQKEQAKHAEISKLEAQAKAKVDNLIRAGKAEVKEDGTVVDKKSGQILVMKPKLEAQPEHA